MNITHDLLLCQSNLTAITQQWIFSDSQLLICSSNLTSITEQFQNCTAALASAGATGDDIDTNDSQIYNQGLHIAAVFIILMASLLGVSLPLASRYHPKLSMDPYYITLGKCAGIGIILACALVHMIQPANEALTDPVLGPAFTEDYPAYAFMYAVMGGLLMHLMDFVLELYLTPHLMEQAIKKHQNMDDTCTHTHETAIEITKNPAVPEHQQQNGGSIPPPTTSPTSRTSITEDVKHHPSYGSVPAHIHIHPKKQYFENDCVDHSHSHAHGVLVATSQRTLSAYLLEFGITVHSVFIGLENGVGPEQQQKTLLIALSFHQFFEGVALGSRIHDAHLPSIWHELWMSLIFILSCPVGIAIGIGVVATLEPEGKTYLLTSGTLDGLCGGILLYIGFLLLTRDFHEDMKRFVVGHPLAKWRRVGMFAALWTGAGLMSLIGKYV